MKPENESLAPVEPAKSIQHEKAKTPTEKAIDATIVPEKPVAPILKSTLASHTVKDLAEPGLKGKDVTLEGFIVKEVNYETMLFSDGTGQVELVLEEDDHLPSNAIRNKARVLIQGVVKVGFGGNVYIEFDTASISPKS
ncbi:MAG: NirD/YgiW/YdeI family stress tolerance protein, partial [Deltaproteobacteria bacterium]|nr:NirD/YgiW/YdeI family stress tolerance protein [Deltaproteobacteria bacterium]